MSTNPSGHSGRDLVHGKNTIFDAPTGASSELYRSMNEAAVRKREQLARRNLLLARLVERGILTRTMIAERQADDPSIPTYEHLEALSQLPPLSNPGLSLSALSLNDIDLVFGDHPSASAPSLPGLSTYEELAAMPLEADELVHICSAIIEQSIMPEDLPLLLSAFKFDDADPLLQGPEAQIVDAARLHLLAEFELLQSLVQPPPARPVTAAPLINPMLLGEAFVPPKNKSCLVRSLGRVITKMEQARDAGVLHVGNGTAVDAHLAANGADGANLAVLRLAAFETKVRAVVAAVQGTTWPRAANNNRNQADALYALELLGEIISMDDEGHLAVLWYDAKAGKMIGGTGQAAEMGTLATVIGGLVGIAALAYVASSL